MKEILDIMILVSALRPSPHAPIRGDGLSESGLET